MRFLASGYQAVSLRAIAADAGVDVALVSYYFGSKQGLFNDAMSNETAEPSTDPAQRFLDVIAGDRSTIGDRVLSDLLQTWDTADKGGSMRALMCESAGDAAMNQMMREKINRQFVEPLARRLGGGPEATNRAAAFSCQIIGVIFSRYILETEPAASMPAAELVELMAPALQATLDESRPAPAGLVLTDR